MSTAISTDPSEPNASTIESTPMRTSTRARRRLRRSGYIGVDIGTTSIKFAHLRKRGKYRDLVSCHTAAISHDPSAATMGKQVGEALRTFGIPRGSIACLLPKACYLEEVIEADTQKQTPDHQFVWSQLQRRGIANPNDLTIDWWPVPQFGPNSDQVRIQAVGLRNRLVSEFVQDCRKYGYRVRCIDSTTFTAARVVELVDAELSNHLVGVLDWGFSSAKLTLIYSGVPVYSRVLRGACSREAITKVASSLNVSESDSALLLKRYGRSQNESRLSPQLRAEIDSQLQCYYRNLAHELARTAGYVRDKLRVTGFQKIIPVGSRIGTTKHFADLASESSLEVLPFHPQIGNLQALGNEPDATYAMAMSLSTLGFEGRTQ